MSIVDTDLALAEMELVSLRLERLLEQLTGVPARGVRPRHLRLVTLADGEYAESGILQEGVEPIL